MLCFVCSSTTPPKPYHPRVMFFGRWNHAVRKSQCTLARLDVCSCVLRSSLLEGTFHQYHTELPLKPRLCWCGGTLAANQNLINRMMSCDGLLSTEEKKNSKLIKGRFDKRQFTRSKKPVALIQEGPWQPVRVTQTGKVFHPLFPFPPPPPITAAPHPPTIRTNANGKRPARRFYRPWCPPN